MKKGDRVNISKLYKSDIWDLIRNPSNYRPVDDHFKNGMLFCAWCGVRIDIPSVPNYFILWSKDNTRYICFHFQCALKKETEDDLNDLLGNFDYKAPL